MRLPRWTVYPALAVIAGLLIAAVPKKSRVDPYAGAAEAALGTTARNFKFKPVIVLGIDGLDPDILAEVVAKYPDKLPNFRWLIGAGDGIRPLGTSMPPQSPVAWSNFITGMNPGGHGIFDFIHRDPVSRSPISSATDDTAPWGAIHFPFGDYKVDLGGDSVPNRAGDAFWTMLARAGIPADIWRMPANFPVEASLGVSFPGMLTPALDSAYGQCSFFSTDTLATAEMDYSKAAAVKEYGGRIDATLAGPANPMREHSPTEVAAFKVYVDRDAGAAVIALENEQVVLKPGQWSHFLKVDFDLLPMGAMPVSGIVRFYLRSIEPEVELYASPVNFDPEAPLAPVSEPEDAAAELTKGIGRYYTQGMAEDVNAVKNSVLTDMEFMQQVELVYRERRDMMDYALDKYLEGDEGGLLFFYYSTVDLSCHMMWRHSDPTHPAHDVEEAAEDSSPWSDRPGSTWKDVVSDLYIKMDPVLGRLRERLGDDVTYIVMSDHGFAPFKREFSLNTWLFEKGYLVLHEGQDKAKSEDHPDYKEVRIYEPGVVDWSKTKAYGIGFNGLYLNLEGREQDNPKTDEDESGIVKPSEAEALLRKIKAELEAEIDEDTGRRPILRCDLASDIYSGSRVAEAPDLMIGYDAGYGNTDSSTTGEIPNFILQDNSKKNHGGKLGTFNGNHLMAPEVVAGTLLSNKPVRDGDFHLHDLTVELLHQYGLPKPDFMDGKAVLR